MSGASGRKKEATVLTCITDKSQELIRDDDYKSVNWLCTTFTWQGNGFDNLCGKIKLLSHFYLLLNCRLPILPHTWAFEYARAWVCECVCARAYIVFLITSKTTDGFPWNLVWTSCILLYHFINSSLLQLIIPTWRPCEFWGKSDFSVSYYTELKFYVPEDHEKLQLLFR
jgi:hypothetical protein